MSNEFALEWNRKLKSLFYDIVTIKNRKFFPHSKPTQILFQPILFLHRVTKGTLWKVVNIFNCKTERPSSNTIEFLPLTLWENEIGIDN